MGRKYMAIASTLLFVLCATAKSKEKDKEKTEENNAKPALTGIAYALPKTALRLEVQISQVKAIPGKYCKYNSLFFPDRKENVDCGKPARTTKITGYSVTPFGVPDPNRIHSVPVDGSWRIARTDSLTMTEGGVMTGADASRQDKTLEIVFGLLGNLATVASKFIGAGDVAELSDDAKKLAKAGQFWYSDEELRANFLSLPKAQQEAYVLYLTSEAGNMRGAWQSYKRIKALAEKLGEVLSGGGAVSAATLIAELKAQIEAELNANFLGLEKTNTANPVYEFVVSDDERGKGDKPKLGVSKFVPFTIAGCGIVEEKKPATANSPAKVLCGDSDDKKGAESLTFTVTERKLEENTGLQVSSRYSAGNGKTFYYSVPSQADLRIGEHCVVGAETKGCPFADVPLLIAQWGPELALPEPGKDYGVTVSLYGATGALQSVKITSKELLNKGVIDSAFAPANTLIDAKKAADKDAETKADELTVLQRRQKLAEAAAAIADKCKNLSPQPSFCKE